MNLPAIDLKMIDDIMGFIEPLYSFLKESAYKLPQAHEFMLNLMKSADSSKHLIDTQGHWNRVKMMEYLKTKRKFLRKLMKGMTQSSNPTLIGYLQQGPRC